MLKPKFYPLAFVLFLSFMIGFTAVYAQDSTPVPTEEVTSVVVVPPAPTAEATVEPPVVVVNPPATDSGPSDRTLIAIGEIVFGLGAGLFIFLQHRRAGDLIEAINNILDKKAVQDEAHAAYTQSSITVQQAIQFGEAFFKLAGGMNLPVVDPLLDKVAEFGDKVTSPVAASPN